jgi:hypothetical protein
MFNPSRAASAALIGESPPNHMIRCKQPEPPTFCGFVAQQCKAASDSTPHWHNCLSCFFRDHFIFNLRETFLILFISTRILFADSLFYSSPNSYYRELSSNPPAARRVLRRLPEASALSTSSSVSLHSKHPQWLLIVIMKTLSTLIWISTPVLRRHRHNHNLMTRAWRLRPLRQVWQLH